MKKTYSVQERIDYYEKLTNELCEELYRIHGRLEDLYEQRSFIETKKGELRQDWNSDLQKELDKKKLAR